MPTPTIEPGYEPGGDLWTPSPSPTEKPYRLTSGDIPGVPIPLEAVFIGEGSIETGYQQETYAVDGWHSDRSKRFFEQHMPDEGFQHVRCGEFDGYESCLYRSFNTGDTRNISVEFRSAGFAITEIENA